MTVYRLKAEDRNLEPLDPSDVYTSRAAALRAFRAAVAGPDPEWGSVYVTAHDEGEEWERVIVSHYVNEEVEQ